ncbi:C6 transcription factor-like protein [Amniculicola lignicola CBS 123094]|uniref:C6 transcription factor-like protein n=1 Tax=Amniculicola lignicola CBS 123094 TaxID=1392246 RepID=A0A6A5WAK3_9PLEO|nr:C6 transcription factor-like protein [Amniculicola lignicola CBS 123094]
MAETNDPDTTSASRKRTHPEDFKRAYKACINCRQRKAKCILTSSTDGGELKPPCQRCRREMRECIFRSERSWVKRRKPGEIETQDNREESPELAATGHDNTSPQQQAPLHRISTSGSIATPSDTPPLGRRGSDHDALLSPAGALRRVSTSQPNLADSVMRTVVSSGQDALNLLFEAAHHRDAIDSQEHTASAGQAYETPRSGLSGPNPSSPFTFRAQPVQMSQPSPETLKIWTYCRFVQMGWFSAHEAITYVDLFFKNCCPLSPILSDFYSHHANHYTLIALDPFLCVTILMISSRYNILPGVGGASRGYFIHDRLWEQCQRFVMKVMLGQVKPSKAQTRTIGSIEALLLLSEWHPRALHFPTASDGWDCELMIGMNTHTEEGTKILEGDATSNRWLEDVIEPAKRSDRMSWMLMGCALSLAQELGLFEDNSNIEKDLMSYPKFTQEFLVLRRIRARKLLFVFIEQLSWRLGCTSMIPQSLNHALMEKIPVDSRTGAVEQWQSFMSAWVELTKLARSVSDTVYPSASFTRNLLRTGRYIGLLEHFQPLLTTWRRKYLDPEKLEVGLHDMLSIEYQYVRIYTNSLGMQAVVERTLAETDPDGPQEDILPMHLEPRDYDFIQEVVDGSRTILEKTTQLAMSGALRYSPVRIFLRITTSSIYLIKGLSLGVRNAKLQSSLDILDRAIHAMRQSTLDDMHLASRYATLLELHVARLRDSFIVSSRPPRLPARCDPLDKSASSGMDFLNNHNAGGSGIAALAEDVTGLMPDDDWLALPFDPSMAPFGLDRLDNQQSFQGFDDGTLDFIWTLPM